MSTSRRTYEAVAAILREHLEEHYPHIHADSDQTYIQYNLGHVAANSDLMTRLADWFKQDNPGFSRAKFYEACNLDRDEQIG